MSEKSEALNKYFVSVFTREDIRAVKKAEAALRPSWSAERSQIQEKSSYRLLITIDPTKSCGPDSIS